MRLHGYDLKTIDAGGLLSGEAAVDLSKEGVSVKVDPTILEVIGSKSSNPTDRIDLGAKIELKAVLLAATLGQLGDQLNSEDVTMKVEATRVKVLPKIDASVVVANSGTDELWTVTNMNYSGDIDGAFKGEDKWHLPVTLKSTATSELTVAAVV